MLSTPLVSRGAGPALVQPLPALAPPGRTVRSTEFITRLLPSQVMPPFWGKVAMSPTSFGMLIGLPVLTQLLSTQSTTLLPTTTPTVN